MGVTYRARVSIPLPTAIGDDGRPQRDRERLADRSPDLFQHEVHPAFQLRFGHAFPLGAGVMSAVASVDYDARNAQPELPRDADYPVAPSAPFRKS